MARDEMLLREVGPGSVWSTLATMWNRLDDETAAFVERARLRITVEDSTRVTVRIAGVQPIMVRDSASAFSVLDALENIAALRLEVMRRLSSAERLALRASLVSVMETGLSKCSPTQAACNPLQREVSDESDAWHATRETDITTELRLFAALYRVSAELEDGGTVRIGVDGVRVDLPKQWQFDRVVEMLGALAVLVPVDADPSRTRSAAVVGMVELAGQAVAR